MEVGAGLNEGLVALGVVKVYLRCVPRAVRKQADLEDPYLENTKGSRRTNRLSERGKGGDAINLETKTKYGKSIFSHHRRTTILGDKTPPRDGPQEGFHIRSAESSAYRNRIACSAQPQSHIVRKTVTQRVSELEQEGRWSDGEKGKSNRVGKWVARSSVP